MLSTYYSLLELLNITEKKPLCVIAGREIYRCNYIKFYALRKEELQYTRIYFIKSVDYPDKGSYLLLILDDDKKDLEIFEFTKDFEVDIEALTYIIMQFIVYLGYNINNYKLYEERNHFYKT